MDFVYDFTELVTQQLEDRGLTDARSVSPSKRFSLLHDSDDRQVPARRYKVHLSEELKSDPSWFPVHGALAEVVERFRTGRYIQPYLSRTTEKVEKADELLQHWGINHLHLSPISTVESDGFVKRSGNLLLFRIEGNNAYLIDVVPHSARLVWSQPEMVQVMDRNWPELNMQLRGVAALSRPLTAENYKVLRKGHVSTVVATDRGVVMPASGVTMAGTSLASVMQWDRNVLVLKRLQDFVAANYERLFSTSPSYVSWMWLVQIQKDGFVVRDGATAEFCFIPISDVQR